MFNLSKYQELKYLVYYIVLGVLASPILLLIYQVPIFKTLQAVFGIAFVMFLPGYFFIILLFDKKELDVIERSALSFSLSIAIVTISIIFTNTILNIPITPINNFLIILFLITVFILIKIIKDQLKK